jgi:hypothetical protein
MTTDEYAKEKSKVKATFAYFEVLSDILLLFDDDNEGD